MDGISVFAFRFANDRVDHAYGVTVEEQTRLIVVLRDGQTVVYSRDVFEQMYRHG